MNWWNPGRGDTSGSLSLANLERAYRDASRASDQPPMYLCSQEEFEFHRRRGYVDPIAWIQHITGASDEDMKKALNNLFGEG